MRDQTHYDVLPVSVEIMKIDVEVKLCPLVAQWEVKKGCDWSPELESEMKILQGRSKQRLNTYFVTGTGMSKLKTNQ